MSRNSALSRHANSLVEPELPLRAYFLSVGGALLLLLLAADFVLPAPLPGRLAEPYNSFPPIRINSELKGPEAIVIDTSQFELTPMLQENESAAAPSQLPGSEIANAAVRVSDDNPVTMTDTRFRESLAQLQPAVHGQAGRAKKQRDVKARQRELAQTQSGQRPISARHPGSETNLGAFH